MKQKILHQPDLPVSATCVRVPIENGHGVSIAVELEKEFSLEQIRAPLAGQFPGILVVDNLAEHPISHKYISKRHRPSIRWAYSSRPLLKMAYSFIP